MEFVNQIFVYSFGSFLALLPIINPLGVVPIFHSLTAGTNARRRLSQARQITINAMAILITFLFTGRWILDFFGISLGVLQIAGGVLIGHTAWEMVVSRGPGLPVVEEDTGDREDITMVPMAIPLISGPGAIAMVINLVAKAPKLSNYLGCLLGIGILGFVLYLSLTLGEPFIRVLGKYGIKVFTRVLGFFILAVAIQFIVNGVVALTGELSLFTVSTP